MTRYRLLEILGTVLVIGGFALVGLGGATILLNLSAIPWAQVASALVPGIALYAAGRAIGKVGERHLQQPVHEQV
jgi:hypothetical protein